MIFLKKNWQCARRDMELAAGMFGLCQVQTIFAPLGPISHWGGASSISIPNYTFEQPFFWLKQCQSKKSFHHRNLRPLWYYLNNQIECRLIGGNRAKSASICIIPWASLKLILIEKTFLMWKGQRKLNLILD